MVVLGEVSCILFMFLSLDWQRDSMHRLTSQQHAQVDSTAACTGRQRSSMHRATAQQHAQGDSAAACTG
eukprot:46813-Chlamydomonas_euryale.AAC.1